MIGTTDEQEFTLSDEKFSELATMELDGIRAALQHVGVPDQDVILETNAKLRTRDNLDGSKVCGPALTWGSVMILVTRTRPKNPSRYTDFLACWIGVDFFQAGGSGCWQAHKPERIRFRRGHIPFVEAAAKFKILHDEVQAKIQVEQDLVAKRNRCKESSKEVLNRLLNEFGVNEDDYWYSVLRGLDVAVCQDQEDVVDISITAPFRSSYVTMERLVALQALLPVGITIAAQFDRFMIRLRANYDQAVYSIKILAAGINPGLFFGQDNREQE